MKRTIPDVDRIRGERLKALRVAAGLLQRQVGAAFDIDKAAVAAWEAGKTKPATERLGDPAPPRPPCLPSPVVPATTPS